MKVDPVVPIDSPSIQKLLSHATKSGRSADDLWEILWLITADCHLLAFTTAASRIVSILEHIPSTWSGAVQDAQISTWLPTLMWVLQEEKTLTRDIGEHFSRKFNTSKNNPMRGSRSTEFPHYSMLCELVPPGPVGDSFILLSAQLFIAHVFAMREHSSVENYKFQGMELEWKFLPTRVGPAALAVRRLSESKYQHFIHELSPELKPEDFVEELVNSQALSDSVIEGDCDALGRFLQKVWGIHDWREKNGGGGGGASGGHRWVGGRLEGSRLTVERLPNGSDDDPATDWGTIDIVKFTSASTRKKNALLKIDLPPDENDDDQEVLLSDFDCSTTKQDPGALARTARTKLRYMTRSNQVLPWDYGTLSKQEITNLHNILDHKLKSLMTIAKWSEQQVLDAESLLTLNIMLWTGSELQRVVQARTCYEAIEVNDTDMSVVIPTQGEIESIRWRIKVLRPEYMTEVDSTPGQVRLQAATYDLPDLVSLSSVVSKLLGRRPNANAKQALFVNQEESISGYIKKWLKQSFPDGRMTINKIQWALWLKVHQYTGDPAVASCVTGTPHPLARVRLHYTSPWATDIQQHYIRAASSLTTVNVADSPCAKLANNWIEKTSPCSVGARLCPTVQAVRSMFTQLKNDIKHAENYLDLAGFIEYHNLLTLYSVQFFAYSTTCRAIVTPYLSFNSIDSTNGLASLSDKDDESCHKTRLVWIPVGLHRHMQGYESHLNLVKERHPRLSESLIQEPCLFLDQNNNFTVVRPKLIEPLLKRYLNVEVNTHRRFLRTELLERDCPPEIVDAFMGHWYSGEEPFGTFSSFSFELYIEKLQRYLEPLLSEINLTQPILSRMVV
jgi:hypothetical protein